MAAPTAPADATLAADLASCAQIKDDFKVKDLSFFTGTWGEQAKWPRLLVFCGSDIPLTHTEYKKVAGMNKVPQPRPRAHLTAAACLRAPPPPHVGGENTSRTVVPPS